MISLNATIDNLIAVVIVLLVLSLVVQAVQSAVKKGLKMKSRQIEDSLAHLFKIALHEVTITSNAASRANATKTTAFTQKTTPSSRLKRYSDILHQSPVLRLITRRNHPAADPAAPEAAALYDEVVGRFRDIGRTAFSTRPIFDSLSKADLLGVLNSLKPQSIDPAFDAKLTAAAQAFTSLQQSFRTWETALDNFNPATIAGVLSDDDKAKLAEMQAKLKPLLDDLHLLLTGTHVDVQTLAGDVKKLRAINLDDVQKIIIDVRSRLSQALASAQVNKLTPAIDALTALDTGLKSLADGITAFRQKFDVVFANWKKVENSFDTVMQGFEERYARGMKTAALIISFLVVVFLNANFFTIYRDISTSDAKRTLILQSQSQVEELYRNQQAQQQASAPDAPTQPKADNPVKVWFETSKKEIDNNASIFTGYGFSPLTWQGTKAWLHTLNPAEIPPGEKMTRWASGNFLRELKNDLKTLIGWIVMTLLLSVGAPFWQDFLESLFGIKNVLRKKSDTQNVEQAAGAGQTKQS